MTSAVRVILILITTVFFFDHAKSNILHVNLN